MISGPTRVVGCDSVSCCNCFRNKFDDVAKTCDVNYNYLQTVPQLIVHCNDIDFVNTTLLSGCPTGIQIPSC